MSKIDIAVKNAITIANDSRHGYDQGSRWGPDYDCSSLMITVWQRAGVPLKTKGATYTGNMKSVCLKCGFKDVIKTVNIKNGDGLESGDILLGNGHVVMYIGSGNIVHASINELGKITGGKPGDQTGKEICVRGYYNKPWTAVLRYVGGCESYQAPADKEILRLGDKGTVVKHMQRALIAAGYSCGASGADGDFGSDTQKALMAMQGEYGLEVDGEYGPISKKKLQEILSGKENETTAYAKGKVYTLKSEMKVRTGPGINYKAKTYSELTTDGKKHDNDKDGALNKGTRITCLAYREVGYDIWIQCPSGWIAGRYGGKEYVH